MSTWILLRGWTREARHWGDFPALLARALPASRVLALDLPGNGRLASMRAPASIGALVEELRRAAPPPPAYLLGLSLGAMVSVEWARCHPAEVAGCVLINTSLRPFSAFYERLRPKTYPALLRLALFEADAQAREAAILALTSSGAHAPELLAEWTRYAQEQSVSRGNVLRQLVAAARYRAPRSGLSVPILILASRRDALVDWRCSEALARRWQAPIRIHESAGHDLTLDDGAWVAARVAEWLMPI